jgi:quinohemoprotein amine dehydrogenase
MVPHWPVLPWLGNLGRAKHPKGFQQFETIGYENGPDGKPNIPDDLMLRQVDASWSVQEFMSVFYDDDKDSGAMGQFP